MTAPYWLRDDSISPWFRESMTPEAWALLRSLRGEGCDVTGFARSSHGPFTARVYRGDTPLAGVGSSPIEALTRLAEKVAT